MSFKTWTERHEGIWQFIKFNVLSNISTATRIVVALVGSFIFISTLKLTAPFTFLIFNYADPSSGGLGGFLTFLLAEVLAQVVNFFVQMKWVFKSSAEFSKAAPKFAVLALVIVVANLILPGYVTSFCQTSLALSAEAASGVASIVNTLLAVVVSFPILKFWISK